MQLTQARDALRDYQKTAYALRHAMSVLYVDGNTAASRESWRGRSKATGYLSGQLYQLAAAPENEDMLSTILSSREDCTPEEVREAELIREDLEDMRLFSRQEYTEHQQLLTQSGTRPRQQMIMHPLHLTWKSSLPIPGSLPNARTRTGRPMTCFWIPMKKVHAWLHWTRFSTHCVQN